MPISPPAAIPPLLFLAAMALALIIMLFVGATILSTATMIVALGFVLIVFGWGDLLWVATGVAIVLLGLGGDFDNGE